MKKKKLIIRLIKDHLINSRLVDGLGALGLHNDFTIHASDTVFKLMGFDDKNEEIYEQFLDWSKEVTKVDIYKFPYYLDAVANALYKLLKRERKYIEDAKKRKKNNV